MTVERIIIELALLKTQIAIAPSVPSTSHERIQLIKSRDAFRDLVQRGPALIPALHAYLYAVPDHALAPLIRSVVGRKRFDVPDNVYPDLTRTTQYCTQWLQANVAKYK